MTVPEPPQPGPSADGAPQSGAAEPTAPASPPAGPPAPSPPPFRVRRVSESEVLPVQMLLAVCGRHMFQAHGFDNWRAPYPLDQLRADARERAVYAVHEHDTLVATFTLGDRPVHSYDESIWQRPGEPAVYVNRLAVLPAEQGRGVGRWCMRWIMGKAAKAGRLAVRLDVLEANERLRAFYRGLGFAERGRREHSGYTFVCMERLIVPRPPREGEA